MYAYVVGLILVQVVFLLLLADWIGTHGKCALLGAVYGAVCVVYVYSAGLYPSRSLAPVTYTFVATFLGLCYFVGRLRGLT
jgi:hypothetical protein